MPFGGEQTERSAVDQRQPCGGGGTDGARLTLVTGLFDLARREPGSERPTVSDYLEWGEFVFGLDCDIVFYVDPELESVVQQRRSVHGLDARTVVVPLALEDLPASAHLQEVDRVRRRHPLINGNPRKDTPLHTILGWSKFELGRRTAAEPPFPATHCAWIDLGLSKVALTEHVAEDSVFTQPGDGVHLLMMRPPKRAELGDERHYLAYIWGQFAAGYVAADSARFEQTCELVLDKAMSILSRGYAATDEQLLGLISRQLDPVFHYGDYTHILANYRVSRGSADNLLPQLRHCRADGQWDRRRAGKIAATILGGCRLGVFECEATLLAEVLEECALALYWADYPDPQAAREVVELYWQQARDQPAFRDVFLRHEIRVRSSFATVTGGG